MRREEQRKRFLEEEKLHTMKKIVEYQREVDELKKEKFRPIEQMTLEPYERDHAVVTGMYRPGPNDFP